MAHIDVHDLGRLRRITAVLTRHGFGSVLASAGLATESGPEGAGGSWAARLRRALVDLGPTFVKLGQVLSVRPDILPPPLIEEFQSLQDEVPPVPWEEARAVLEAELHQPVDEVFAEIDPTPVASASIAQVHLGRLADGGEVAVKVQRPGIAEVIRSDVHILTTLAHLLEGRVELPGVYTPVGIVQELEQAIRQELDFLQEARSQERMRANLAGAPGVHVPQVHRRWCSRRVLVTERLDGVRVSSLRAGHPQARALVTALVGTMVEQVFEHAFFHADPHPGNLLLLSDGRLGLLDFGLCGTLTPEMRDTVLTILVALLTRDADLLAQTAYRAGATDERVDPAAFRREVGRLMERLHGATLAEISNPATTRDIIGLATRHRIRLPAEYALLARAAALVDGTARRLVPDADLVAIVEPAARRVLARRFAPERLGADALRMLVQLGGGMRELPGQLARVLVDVERGRLQVVARDPSAEALRATVRSAAGTIAIALSSAACLVAAALLQLAPPTEPPSMRSLLPVALLALALLGWSALALRSVVADPSPRGLARALLRWTRAWFRFLRPG